MCLSLDHTHTHTYIYIHFQFYIYYVRLWNDSQYDVLNQHSTSFPINPRKEIILFFSESDDIYLTKPETSRDTTRNYIVPKDQIQIKGKIIQKQSHKSKPASSRYYDHDRDDHIQLVLDHDPTILITLAVPLLEEEVLLPLGQNTTL